MLSQHDATTIRYPSIANLMVDSADRNLSGSPNANSFTITRPYSMLNGSFTRVATTEIVMEWNTPNITGEPAPGLFTFAKFLFDPAGGLPVQTLSIDEGFYTAADLINTIVAKLNTLTSTTGRTYTIAQLGSGSVKLVCAGTTTFCTLATAPSSLSAGCIDFIARLFNGPLGLGHSDGSGNFFTSPSVDLRKYRYVDIVSPTLTYAQKVKDASTANIVRDVLCRWYFDYDEQNLLDQYGYPILMGYTQFAIRRIFNPPKQIKWDNNLPVSGNMVFEVYDPVGKLANMNNVTYNDGNVSTGSNFLLTLQVSEN